MSRGIVCSFVYNGCNNSLSCCSASNVSRKPHTPLSSPYLSLSLGMIVRLSLLPKIAIPLPRPTAEMSERRCLWGRNRYGFVKAIRMPCPSKKRTHQDSHLKLIPYEPRTVYFHTKSKEILMHILSIRKFCLQNRNLPCAMGPEPIGGRPDSESPGHFSRSEGNP